MVAHRTSGLNNPWRHLQKMLSWVGNHARPPYVNPRGSVGGKKQFHFKYNYPGNLELRFLRTEIE